MPKGKKKTSKRAVQHEHTNGMVGPAPVTASRKRKREPSKPPGYWENLERSKKREEIESLTSLLGRVANFVDIGIARSKLSEYRLVLAFINRRGWVDQAWMLKQAMADGVELLNSLFDFAPLVHFKDLQSSGLLRELLKLVVSITDEEEEKCLQILARRAKFGLKRLCGQMSRMDKDQFGWSTDALNRLMDGAELNPAALPQTFESFVGLFVLQPGTRVYQLPSLAQLTSKGMDTQLSSLNSVVSDIEQAALTLSNDINIKFRREGLACIAALLEFLVDVVLFDEDVTNKAKNLLHTVISTLATHTDLLPELNIIYHNVPMFLGVIRRMIYTRQPLQDALPGQGTCEDIERIYRALHPNKEEVQLCVPGNTQKCNKDLVYEPTPLFLTSVQIYCADFQHMINNPPIMNPYPASDYKSMSSAVAITGLYSRAMRGISGPEWRYDALQTCREAERALELLERNRDIAPKRILTMGQTSLLGQLLHSWQLIPDHTQNQKLFQRIVAVSMRCDRLESFWKLMCQEERAKENEIARRATADRVGSMHGERPSTARSK